MGSASGEIQRRDSQYDPKQCRGYWPWCDVQEEIHSCNPAVVVGNCRPVVLRPFLSEGVPFIDVRARFHNIRTPVNDSRHIQAKKSPESANFFKVRYLPHNSTGAGVGFRAKLRLPATQPRRRAPVRRYRQPAPRHPVCRLHPAHRLRPVRPVHRPRSRQPQRLLRNPSPSLRA